MFKKLGSLIKKIAIALVVLVAISMVFGGRGGSSSSSSSSSQKEQQVQEAPKEEATTDEAATEEAATADETPAEETTAEEPAKEVQTIYHVGDTLDDGGLKIVYMASGEHIEDNEFLQPKDGYKYVFLKLAFINESSSDKSVSFYSFDAYADGYAVDMYYGGEEDLSATLSAGRSTSGYIYFEVPIDAQKIEVEYTPNAFFSDKITFAYDGDADSGYELEANTSRTSGALAVGDTLEGKKLNITFLSADTYYSDNMFVQPKDGYNYVSVELEFENTGDSDKSVSSLSFDCFADGMACEQTYIRDDDLSATISPGRKVKGTVTFEVPDDATVVEVEYEDNIWTSSRIVFTVR